MTTPELPWYDIPLFFQITTIDALVLMVVGTVWSAGVWVLTEGLKKGLGMTRPYPGWLMWAPILGSGFASVIAFPVALAGVGQQVTPSPELAAGSILVGLVGGLGAKAAHDRARRLMDAGFDKAVEIIGGQSE